MGLHKLKGLYEGKSSKELYGVSEEELIELYDILPRGTDGELVEISKKGTIEVGAYRQVEGTKKGELTLYL